MKSVGNKKSTNKIGRKSAVDKKIEQQAFEEFGVIHEPMDYLPNGPSAKQVKAFNSGRAKPSFVTTTLIWMDDHPGRSGARK
jgi:hypothetical protein